MEILAFATNGWLCVAMSRMSQMGYKQKLLLTPLASFIVLYHSIKMVAPPMRAIDISNRQAFCMYTAGFWQQLEYTEKLSYAV